jgi:phage shock protein PspC (stress-responsive transcriptional regulator)
LPEALSLYNKAIEHGKDKNRRLKGEPAMKKLYLSRTNRMMTGLCGGIAEWLGINATIVRLLTVIAAFISLGCVLLIYLLAVMIVPKAPHHIVPPEDPFRYHSF